MAPAKRRFQLWRQVCRRRGVPDQGSRRPAAFYSFPAEHWDHVRTTNPIESVFATVRHRTMRTKGALSQDTAKLMVFKLITAAARTWRRLKGENQLPKLIQGVTFRDGIEVNVPTSNSAASQPRHPNPAIAPTPFRCGLDLSSGDQNDPSGTARPDRRIRRYGGLPSLQRVRRAHDRQHDLHGHRGGDTAVRKSCVPRRDHTVLPGRRGDRPERCAPA
jgi:hypothetical protein